MEQYGFRTNLKKGNATYKLTNGIYEMPWTTN
jgi:hypothetical protein